MAGDLPLDPAARHAARRRALADRRAPAARDVRPLGHRRALDNLHEQTRGPTISSTTATRAASDRAAGFVAFDALVGDAYRLVSECPCERAARPACSRPSAGTSTSRSPRPGPAPADGPDAGVRPQLGAHDRLQCWRPSGTRPTHSPSMRHRPYVVCALTLFAAAPASAAAAGLDTGGTAAPSARGGSSYAQVLPARPPGPYGPWRRSSRVVPGVLEAGKPATSPPRGGRVPRCGCGSS